MGRGRLLHLALLLLVSPLGAACASAAPLRPERPHPTPDEITTLARSTIGDRVQPSAPRRLDLTLSSSFVFAGGSVRLTCHVPESYGAGRIRLALEGVAVKEAPLDLIETRLLIDRVPCGTWEASCTIQTRAGQERRTRSLESRGMCDGH